VLITATESDVDGERSGMWVHADQELDECDEETNLIKTL
jgi:hypothetical protein